MSNVLEQYAPSAEESTAAEAVTHALVAGPDAGPQLITSDNQIVAIPDGLAQLFEVVARAAADGQRISVRVGDEPLSPREAADELGVSRTYLCRLMDDGKIAFQRVGTHRRIDRDEVERYRALRADRLADTYRDALAGVADAPDAPMPDGPRVRRRRPSKS